MFGGSGSMFSSRIVKPQPEAPQKKKGIDGFTFLFQACALVCSFMLGAYSTHHQSSNPGNCMQSPAAASKFMLKRGGDHQTRCMLLGCNDPSVVALDERPSPKQAVQKHTPPGQDPYGTQVSHLVLERAYWESTYLSAQEWVENGGMIDGKSISAGQGSKVRIWDYFGPFYSCASRERVGKIGDGGKWVCGVKAWLEEKDPCVVYAIGSKGEVSFEQGVQQKMGHCQLHVFDPTLNAEQKKEVHSVSIAQLHDYGLHVKDGKIALEDTPFEELHSLDISALNRTIQLQEKKLLEKHLYIKSLRAKLEEEREKKRVELQDLKQQLGGEGPSCAANMQELKLKLQKASRELERAEVKLGRRRERDTEFEAKYGGGKETPEEREQRLNARREERAQEREARQLEREQERAAAAQQRAAAPRGGAPSRGGRGSRHLTWIQTTKSQYMVFTLQTIMQKLGHDWIDVLKIDIEGGEWEVFKGMFGQMERLPITQILIELHYYANIPEVIDFFKEMQARRFRVFSVEPNYYGRTPENARNMVEYSFIQVNDDGAIVTDAGVLANSEERSPIMDTYTIKAKPA